MNKLKLSQSTIEKLNYYVYLLIDPRDKKVFYVGKGVGNRIYQHVLGTLKDYRETKKNNRINEIKNLGLEVEHKVLRHGLDEKEAFEIESAMIDFIGMENLTNAVKGHHSEERGIATINEIKVNYEAEKLIPEEPLLLININNLYNKMMTTNEIYEATRKSWKISLHNANKIKVICSVYRGIIREVFTLKEWYEYGDGRNAFNGEIAPEEVRKKYIDKCVKEYWRKGNSNPIRYTGIE